MDPHGVARLSLLCYDDYQTIISVGLELLSAEELIIFLARSSGHKETAEHRSPRYHQTTMERTLLTASTLTE